MRLLRNRCTCLLAALAGWLACTAALPQEAARAEPAALERVALPASARPLAAAAEPSSAAEAPAVSPHLAEGAEEIVVEGRSMPFLRDQLALAEEHLYSVYNEINTIEEFDIHCRWHAPTGTRMVQRQCLPNFVRGFDERKAQAFHRVLGGEQAYDLDWQSPMAQLDHKTEQLQEHMQALALAHPELLDAMRELHGLMEAVYPGRFGAAAEQETRE